MLLANKGFFEGFFAPLIKKLTEAYIVGDNKTYIG